MIISLYILEAKKANIWSCFWMKVIDDIFTSHFIQKMFIGELKFL